MSTEAISPLWKLYPQPLFDARVVPAPNLAAVQPQAIYLTGTDDALALIEYAGRVSYKSHPKGTPADFIRMLLRQGHDSVLEHSSCTFHLVTDRGITHELVRHRIGTAYTQESTRWINYEEEGRFGGIQVLLPSTHKEANRELYMEAFYNAQQSYEALIRAGETPQNARAVLPTGLKTEIVVTMNFREFRHMLSLRMAPNAHPDFRRLAAQMTQALLARYFPVFEDRAATSEAILELN